jgi:hypothetical protein
MSPELKIAAYLPYCEVRTVFSFGYPEVYSPIGFMCWNLASLPRVLLLPSLTSDLLPDLVLGLLLLPDPALGALSGMGFIVFGTRCRDFCFLPT